MRRPGGAAGVRARNQLEVAGEDMDDQLDAAAHGQLVVDPLNMGVDSVGRDSQFPCDRPIGQVFEDALNDLGLTLG